MVRLGFWLLLSPSMRRRSAGRGDWVREGGLASGITAEQFS